MVGGLAWQEGCAWQRSMHGRGHMAGVCGRYYKIWSMNGQYAFYWNAEGGICGGVAGGMHGRGVCMAEGHAQQGSMHGRGHMEGGVYGRYYEIWSMSGRYISYWNAFLLPFILCVGGVCMAGGMCGKGACMHSKGGMHGGCMVGDMHSRGACTAGGYAWQGGMHGRGWMAGGCAWQILQDMVNEWAVCILLECREGHVWGCGRGHAWQGGVHGRGACTAGEHAWQGGTWKGVCMADTMRYGQRAGDTYPT